IDMYQSDYCITLDELPADLYTNGNIVTTKPTGTTTKPVTTTTTTATSGSTTEIKADLAETAEGYRFTFDEAVGDKLYVVLEADKAVTFANGCIGISATVGGTDYWVSYQWKIAGSDTVKVDLSSPFEVSYNNGEDKVTDKALIAEIAAEAQKQNTGLVQIWWVNDSAGEQIDNSNIVLVDAYIVKSSMPDPTTTTESQITTTETTTTTTVSSDTDATTTTTTTATNSDTTTTTTSSTTTTTKTTGSGEQSVLLGDLNLDDTVSMIDVIYLNKYVANIIKFNDAQMANAECCADGNIDSGDSIALLKYLVNAVKTLPIVPGA
ncbi:MAG: dockerin type I repeat-containing protein, partial [Ruminococcus sp.]